MERKNFKKDAAHLLRNIEKIPPEDARNMASAWLDILAHIAKENEEKKSEGQEEEPEI